jgi:hypothetical protein
MTPEELSEWNKKLYQGKKELGADWFWDNFQLKSAPLYPNACWYHIPEDWERPVAILLATIQQKFGDRIELIQVKEKFCTLVVYFSAATDEIYDLIQGAVELTRQELRERGVHP